MSLEDTELKIGGTSFKGVWIAIVLTLGTSIGGTVWTASSLYSRLEAVEARSIPDIKPLGEEVSLIQQELKSNDVGQLQGKLAELGTNLKTIVEQQNKLLTLQDKVSDLEKKIIAMETTVQKAESVVGKVDGFDKDVGVVKREIQDLWDAMDYLSNPLN